MSCRSFFKLVKTKMSKEIFFSPVLWHNHHTVLLSTCMWDLTIIGLLKHFKLLYCVYLSSNTMWGLNVFKHTRWKIPFISVWNLTGVPGYWTIGGAYWQMRCNGRIIQVSFTLVLMDGMRNLQMVSVSSESSGQSGSPSQTQASGMQVSLSRQWNSPTSHEMASKVAWWRVKRKRQKM